MFNQLNPMLPVHVIGRGDGYAMAVIDYGQEHNLIWVTSITETGEIWCAPNPTVRMTKNWTMGRPGRVTPRANTALSSASPLEVVTESLKDLQPVA